MHKEQIKTLILILIDISHHDFNKNNLSETELIKQKLNRTKNESRLNLETENFFDEKWKKKKKKKEIRVLNDETRNQAQEIRVVAIAEAEQA